MSVDRFDDCIVPAKAGYLVKLPRIQKIAQGIPRRDWRDNVGLAHVDEDVWIGLGKGRSHSPVRISNVTEIEFQSRVF